MPKMPRTPALVPLLLRSIKIALTENASPRWGAKIRASVIHTTESPPGSMDAVVAYFRREGVRASAHYVVGDEPTDLGWTEVTRVVPERLSAWTQLSANRYCVSYELVGYARRRRGDWLGPYRAQLETAAALCAQDAVQYGLPIRHGFPGQLGHRDLTRYGFPQTHTDPGDGFPWDVFEREVARYAAGGWGRPPTRTARAPRARRPPGAPRRIPRWAWRLHAWQLSQRPRKGPAPRHPSPLPSWYYPWRAWRLGITDHAADAR